MKPPMTAVKRLVPDQGEPVGVTVGARAYNGNREWNPEPGATFEGDYADGSATITGVLCGTASCEGLQYVFEVVWDEESGNFAMAGEVELAG